MISPKYAGSSSLPNYTRRSFPLPQKKEGRSSLPSKLLAVQV